MKRKPTDPIPGFPEYSGTVGYEKKIHRDHFNPWTDEAWERYQRKKQEIEKDKARRGIRKGD